LFYTPIRLFLFSTASSTRMIELHPREIGFLLSRKHLSNHALRAVCPWILFSSYSRSFVTGCLLPPWFPFLCFNPPLRRPQNKQPYSIRAEFHGGVSKSFDLAHCNLKVRLISPSALWFLRPASPPVLQGSLPYFLLQGAL